MQNVLSAWNELEAINESYGLPNETIAKLRAEMGEAKVCTPIIGKFSSGKSAVINSVLGGRRVLKEDITPETAVPAEIVATEGADAVTVVRQNGSTTALSLQEYRRFEATSREVSCLRLRLNNEFLRSIPAVMIVDMPGFESDFELHNRAIDSYLPQSLAYMVAFPADDMIVRDSVGMILRELCLHDMPLCVVITKGDKRNDEFEVTLAKLKESLKRYVGERDIRYCITSSFLGEAQELRDFLVEMQEQSQFILARKYKQLTLPLVESTAAYLATSLKGSSMSASELDEQEDRLKRQLAEVEAKFTREQQSFNQEISFCVDEIMADVQRALNAEESSFIAMALNNQSIDARLNSVVRSAVTVGVQRRFMPKVEKYLSRVNRVIGSVELGEVHAALTYNVEKADTAIVTKAVAVVAARFLGGPLVALITGICELLISFFAGQSQREEAKQQIRCKLHGEVFPQVLGNVRSGLGESLSKQIAEVNASIAAELDQQRESFDKALADLRQRMDEERIAKENLQRQIQNDLSKIEEIRDGLR